MAAVPETEAENLAENFRTDCPDYSIGSGCMDRTDCSFDKLTISVAVKQDNLLNYEISENDNNRTDIQPLQNLRPLFKFENQVKNQENDDHNTWNQTRIHDQTINKFTAQHQNK